MSTFNRDKSYFFIFIYFSIYYNILSKCVSGTSFSSLSKNKWTQHKASYANKIPWQRPFANKIQWQRPSANKISWQSPSVNKIHWQETPGKIASVVNITTLPTFTELLACPFFIWPCWLRRWGLGCRWYRRPCPDKGKQQALPPPVMGSGDPLGTAELQTVPRNMWNMKG